MDGQWRYLLPAPVRRLPADLAAVAVATLATLLVVAAPVVRETPLRVVVGLPFVLFLPGYALVALLFPEAGEPPGEPPGESPGDAARGAPGSAVGSGGAGAGGNGLEDDAVDDATASTTVLGRDRGIDGVERVALSFGLSIAVVPLLGLALNFTPFGIRLWPVLSTVSAFTLGCAAGAAQRRWALPPAERFRVPYRDWLGSARGAAFDPDDPIDAGLNVVLALSVLLAVGSVGFAIAVPPDGERFTEFYVLTEDGGEELVAADYPRELTAGEPVEVVLGVGNQEHERAEYTVVAQLQRVERGDGETRVLERTELDRLEVALAHNETWHREHEVVPTTTGEDLRLKYLLYRGAPPAEPTTENAYRDLHLWIDVVEA